MEKGSQVERTRSKAMAGGPREVVDCGAGQAKLQLDGEAAGGGPVTDCTTQGSRMGKQSLKPLIENICGGRGGGRNSQPHRRVP